MFDKIADFIMKNPKKIVIFWVVLLLISSPFIYKVLADPGSVLSYDITSMTGEDSESVKGMAIIGDSDYFYQSDVGTDMLLVINCDSSDQKIAIAGFSEQLTAKLQEHYGLTKDGGQVVETMSLGYYTKSTDTGYPGIVMLSVSFTDGRNSGDEVDQIRSIVSDVKNTGSFDLTTYLTGSTAISHDTEVEAMNDVKKIDPFSILLVLILIGLFFRSLVSAATPPITIGFAYGIVMMVIFGIAQFMDIYYITSTIVLVSMLGAGCDYCIFIIARYREERKAGKDKEGALRESIIWAGESITTSGCSVIIGFGVMSFCSFSVISTMGIVLASGIVFALLAALTLIPSILMLVGDKIFYPSSMETYTDGSKAMNGWYGKCSRIGQSYFRKSAHFSVKYAVPIIIVAIIVTTPLAYVALTEDSSYDMISIMPSGESKNGVNEIVENAEGGMIMPTYVLLDTGTQIADIKNDVINIPSMNMKLGALQWTDASLTAAYVNATSNASSKGTLPYIINEKTLESDGTTNVASVSGIVSWDLLLYQCGGNVELALSYFPSYISENLALLAYVDDTTWKAITGQDVYTQSNAIDYIVNYYIGGLSMYNNGHQYIKVSVIVADQPMSDKSMTTMSQVEAATNEFMDGNGMFVKSYVTGSVVAIYDISNVVNNEFTWIEVTVVLLIFLLLFVVMRSYLTPARSIVTIIMSILWTLGVTHLLFGHMLGMPITWIVPIILFVICLGLGMDYDILLTTRIKENVSKGMDNDDAIIHAVEKSGGVITICGLIMGGAFATMTLSTSPMLMEFGFALGFAILVDALIVRTYIVPAVMHLMGKWNWVGPKFMQKKNVEKTE